MQVHRAGGGIVVNDSHTGYRKTKKANSGKPPTWAKLREKTQHWVYHYKTSETTQATVLDCDDSDED